MRVNQITDISSILYGKVPIKYTLMSESGKVFTLILNTQLTYNGFGYTAGYLEGGAMISTISSGPYFSYTGQSATIPFTGQFTPQPIKCGLSGDLSTLPPDYASGTTTFSNQTTTTQNNTEKLSLAWSYGKDMVFYAWFSVDSITNTPNVDYNLNTVQAYLPALGTTINGTILSVGNQAPTLNAGTFKLVKFVVPAKTLATLPKPITNPVIEVKFSGQFTNVMLTDMQGSPLVTFVKLG